MKERGTTERRRGGFTLVEIMVVVSVTAMLAGVILVYNSSSRDQILLSTEKVKFTQVVLRAKSLAISTYSDVSVPCGYGISVDPASRTYSLVRYTFGDCTILDRVDTTSGNITPVQNGRYTLPPGLSFDAASSSLRYVIFIPPDPRVLLATGDGTLIPTTSGDIVLTSGAGTYRAVISVNKAGQVTF